MVQQKLDSKIVIDASLRAAEILTGMGYQGKYGSVHLLRLNIQTNTLTAKLHNMIAWQISELDKRWALHQVDGLNAYLTNDDGSAIQFRVICGKRKEINRIKPLPGLYSVITYSKSTTDSLTSIKIEKIEMVEVTADDWLIQEKPARIF